MTFLLQCLPLVHGNSTTSKYCRRASKTWWRTFQVGAITTAINKAHSGSRELKRTEFFCMCYATSSSVRKRCPTSYIETVYCGVRNRIGISVLYLYMRIGCSKSSFWRLKCDVCTTETIWGWKLLRIQLFMSICHRLLYFVNFVEEISSCFKFFFCHNWRHFLLDTT
jgi:hypothetical protein